MPFIRSIALTTCFLSSSSFAGTFAGYFTDSSGGNVTLIWPSQFGDNLSDSWQLPAGGPYVGAFNSAAERNFNGESQIGFVSSRCHGDLPPADITLPAHLHFAAILAVENYGNDEIIAAVNNQGYARTYIDALYWKLSWSIAYTSESVGDINFQIDVPSGVGHTIASGGFATGTNLRGNLSGNFAFRGTLTQGPIYPASGKLTFMMDVIVSDTPLPECPADLNFDNQVDDADFSIFVVSYNVLECSSPSMPSDCASDLNHDSVVDDVDFSQFVTAYDALICS